jgi:hypothetical protein
MGKLMLEKSLKIFIGPCEIANIGATLGDAFRKRGIKVTVVCTGNNPFRDGMKYDEIISPPDVKNYNRIERKYRLGIFWGYRFFKYFISNNLFIFLFGVTLFPKNFDLKFYKLFRKKTIMWFQGSDIKDIEKREFEIKKMGIKYIHNESVKESDFEKKQKREMIRRVEKYVDHILADREIAQLLTKEYIGKDGYDRVHLPFDINSIKYNNIPNEKILVVHAPSNSQIKGTDCIVRAIGQLKKEGYDFEFRLLENIPNSTVRKTLSEADIAIDQLFAFGPGMFAIEAMAAGCAVLGGNMPQISFYPSDLPIIHTDPENIYQNLKMLLEKKEFRQSLAEKGREYVEKYNDHMKVIDRIIKNFA